MKTLTLFTLLIIASTYVELATAQSNSASTSNTPVEAASPLVQLSPTPCNSMSPEIKKSLFGQIEDQLGHYDRGRKWWSKLYHGSLYGSALLSALAALVLKLDLFKRKPYRKYQNDLAALLASLAAILITFNGGGEFYKRWQLDRLAQKSTEDLRDDFNTKCMTVDEVRVKLSEIKQKQSEYKAEK